MLDMSGYWFLVSIELTLVREMVGLFRSRFLLSRVTQSRLKRKTCTALQILSTGSRGIENAASIVMKGGIVAYPTDTV